MSALVAQFLSLKAKKKILLVTSFGLSLLIKMHLFQRAECNSYYLFGSESPELPLYRAKIRCDFLFIISKPALGSLSLLLAGEVSLFVSVFQNVMGLGGTLNSVAYSCILRNTLSKTSGCL